ncbi:MAG: hypothetical protein EA424_02965 [Planctomycetaceae bacterium]|nr:MAG: hypothetical protein EA424_02965 [Planctomycetaceae bacterium]
MPIPKANPSPTKRMRIRTPCTFLVFLLALLLAAPAAADRVRTADPDNYRQILNRLQPGDTLQLAAGIYRDGLSLHSLQGTPDRPITITGPENGGTALFLGREGRITISLIDVSHITLRHLSLDGEGKRGHGIVAEGRGRFTHDVTLENLEITRFDADQAFNAISTKAPAWNWVIRDNVISHVGTGLYLGDSDGSAPFVAGFIEGNRIEHTTGYNMQIKHQAPRPDLAGLPTTPRETVIRNNVFDKSLGGSDGPMARPNLLLGHWPLEGPGKDDRYLVYGNLFFQNLTERLFQAEGNVIAYNNLFVNLFGEAVSFQAHNDQPRRIWFVNNTALGLGPALRLSGADERFEQIIDGNAIFAERPEESALPGENLITSLPRAEEVLTNPFAAVPDALDLSPVGGSLDRAAAGIRLPPDLPATDQDYRGKPRGQAMYGAVAR